MKSGEEKEMRRGGMIIESESESERKKGKRGEKRKKRGKNEKEGKKDGPGPVIVSDTLCPAVHIFGT